MLSYKAFAPLWLLQTVNWRTSLPKASRCKRLAMPCPALFIWCS